MTRHDSTVDGLKPSAAAGMREEAPDNPWLSLSDPMMFIMTRKTLSHFTTLRWDGSVGCHRNNIASSGGIHHSSLQRSQGQLPEKLPPKEHHPPDLI